MQNNTDSQISNLLNLMQKEMQDDSSSSINSFVQAIGQDIKPVQKKQMNAGKSTSGTVNQSFKEFEIKPSGKKWGVTESNQQQNESQGVTTMGQTSMGQTSMGQTVIEQTDQNMGVEKKKKNQSKFANQPQGKQSSGCVNPEFKPFVITPSNKKWGGENGEEIEQQSKQQLQQKQELQQEQVQQEYERKIEEPIIKVYKQTLASGILESNIQQHATQSYVPSKQERQSDIPLSLTMDFQEDLKEIENKYNNNLNSDNNEKKEETLEKSSDNYSDLDKEEEIDFEVKQEDHKEVIVEEKQVEQKPVNESQNKPSTQLDRFKYYEDFLKEQEKEKKDKENYTEFIMPAIYQEKKKQEKIKEDTKQIIETIKSTEKAIRVIDKQEEQEQEDDDIIYEEEAGEEDETNDSELQNQAVLYEVHRELIEEKPEKNEKIYRIKYNNEDVYEGEIDEKTNLKDGWGTYFYANGEKYEGCFSDDLIDGYGKYWFLGGHFYEGDWDKGSKSGIGELIFANKDYYSGQFDQDTYHGTGTLKYGNGDEYEGGWEHGKKHGRGQYREKGRDGRVLLGDWENDEVLPF